MTNLKIELANHILNYINENKAYQEIDLDELHQLCFNQDYYIIGYYPAKQWLIEHFGSVFDAMGYAIDYEQDNFGEFNTDIDSESIANMCAYIAGEALINELEVDLDVEIDNGLESVISQLEAMINEGAE